MRKTCLPSIITVTLLLSSSSLLAADSPEGVEFFEKKIRPVLVAKCYGCHSADADKIKGGLVLDTREGIRRGGDTGPAVRPGKASESLLLTAIRYQGDLEMPPKERLDAPVIEDFAKWIAMGAPDPRNGNARPAALKTIDLEAGRKHWAYQPVSNSAVPKSGDANWARTDIDRFILAGLETKGLRPVANAAPLELLRRISLDLTGLPPTPQKIADFQAAYERSGSASVASLIDELLASPHFGERWGRRWLDVARYAESVGGAGNNLVPMAPRYRDYVINAFNADKPYDQFIREQIAGDLLPADSTAQRNEQLIASGFLALGLKELGDNKIKRFRMDVVDEQIDVTGRAFLGQTIACARCHDHKFDPIPTRDYYALAGIFFSSQPRMGVDSKNNHYVAALEPLAGGEADFTEEDLKTLIKVKGEARKSNLFLRDEKHRVLLKAGMAKATLKEQEAFLADNPVVKDATAKRDEQAAGLAVLQHRFDAHLRQSAVAMRDVEPQDLAIHIRGEDTQLGEVVSRGFPQVLVHPSTPRVNARQSGRLELAEWIASPDNTLTARVMVNRIWQQLFGVGLVDSPDNFGATGQPPSNPALLDHLSRRLIGHRWSVKSLIREIMLTRTYQLSAAHDARAHEVDPANRLHWRMNRRRLDSDAIFDSMLFISGELELGPPPERFAIVDGDQRVKSFDRKKWLEPVANRRTIYQPIFREYVPEHWSVFDFPDPQLLVGKREISTVPTQALYLMNSPFVVERSQHLARRIGGGAPEAAQAAAIQQAYLHVLGRPPSEQEADEGRAFLKQFDAGAQTNVPHPALVVFCQTLFASAEFRYIY